MSTNLRRPKPNLYKRITRLFSPRVLFARHDDDLAIENARILGLSEMRRKYIIELESRVLSDIMHTVDSVNDLLAIREHVDDDLRPYIDAAIMRMEDQIEINRALLTGRLGV